MNLLIHVFGHELLSIRIGGQVLITEDTDPGEDEDECLEMSRDDDGRVTAVVLSGHGVGIVGHLDSGEDS